MKLAYLLLVPLTFALRLPIKENDSAGILDDLKLNDERMRVSKQEITTTMENAKKLLEKGYRCRCPVFDPGCDCLVPE